MKHRLSRPPLPRGLYVLINEAPDHSEIAFAEAALQAGVRLLQLRMKTAPAHRVVEVGRAIVQRCLHYGAHLIVNDRADLAAIIGAQGVHVGQADLPPEAARTLLPSGLIGLSTHDLVQVQEANRLFAAGVIDYIGFGPIFATPSKADALAPRGVALLSEAVAIANMPLYAIGGIGSAQVPSIVQSGAHGMATISAVTHPHSHTFNTAAYEALSQVW